MEKYSITKGVMTEFASIRALLDAWPTRQALAADLSLDPARVYKWASAGSIPAQFHCDLLAAARTRGIALDAEALVRLHARREDAA